MELSSTVCSFLRDETTSSHVEELVWNALLKVQAELGDGRMNAFESEINLELGILVGVFAANKWPINRWNTGIEQLIKDYQEKGSPIPFEEARR